MAEWSRRTSWDEVCRRVAGRRKYNQWQRAMAAARQDEVFTLLLAYGWHTWGTLTKIAQELQVHRSTITRDRQRIMRAMRGHETAALVGLVTAVKERLLARLLPF
jgi:hypothetical protein